MSGHGRSTADNGASVTFTLDGEQVQGYAGESILQTSIRLKQPIPHLCYCEGQRSDGNCRSCMVEINDEKALSPACRRQPTEGMQVHTRSSRARNAQRGVIELLLSEVAHPAQAGELSYWAKELNANAEKFPPRQTFPAADLSHPAINVSLDNCIQCGRCLQACREEQVNDVIGWAGRGAATQISFDLNQSLATSSCVACGECVQACPTTALDLKSHAQSASTIQPRNSANNAVDSVCPYCGVGCLVRYRVEDNKIVSVEGRNGATNHGRLCVKGRFGFDYLNHPQRLLRPLIRRNDAKKSAALPENPDDYRRAFREASWEEALEYAASGLRTLRDSKGGHSLAGFGSAKGSNEEAYLFQKLIRTGLGTNNVDHCTRLCHASSVAALLEGVGSGAVSNPVADVRDADVIVVIGANPDSNHPVAASFMKNAAKAGKTLIVMDPRRIPMARHSRYFLQFLPDSDVALLNALIHTIIDEQLYDQDFIARRTEGFDELRQSSLAFSPEAMAPLCGIAATRIREVARCYATANNAMIFWGMGISQHVHGTDNARCLITLAMITGQIGRPGTGLHPLRGQNNVQGASDAGLIPMMLPDYQRVDNNAARTRFEQLWDCKLPPDPGLTVVEIMHGARAGTINGLYIMGENPAMSDPNLNETRAALASLDHLVVQDLFMTETAAYADVILPASGFAEKTGTFTNTDRRVQLGRQAVEPPGEARQDLWIIQQLAHRLGLNWPEMQTEDVYAEMHSAMPSLSGISWRRLLTEDSVTYPCATEQQPGEAVLFRDSFPTATGRARLVPAPLRYADERPDAHYPWVLLTGRQLEHWHTGSMTRRSAVLDALEPRAWVALSPDDLASLGIAAGDQVRLQSRRGEITTATRIDSGLLPGQVFMPFGFVEAAINLLTNDALDPDGKIAEVKYCAVKVTAV